MNKLKLEWRETKNMLDMTYYLVRYVDGIRFSNIITLHPAMSGFRAEILEFKSYIFNTNDLGEAQLMAEAKYKELLQNMLKKFL